MGTNQRIILPDHSFQELIIQRNQKIAYQGIFENLNNTKLSITARKHDKLRIIN